jgi:pilus assembly protein Flp/PilA
VSSFSVFIYTLNRKEKTMKLFRFVRTIRKREEGQTLAEYALILALIAVVVIAAVTLLGVNIMGILNQIAGAI